MTMTIKTESERADTSDSDDNDREDSQRRAKHLGRHTLSKVSILQ